MEINKDYRPIDPATRKRQNDAARVGAQAQAPTPPAGAGDAVQLNDTGPAAVARYVQILKSMNPVDLHRVEELRSRIRDGSYRADPEELAGPLASLFGDDGDQDDPTSQAK
jgi:flagellar biosynthesis anti-sigma factor FlgM